MSGIKMTLILGVWNFNLTYSMRYFIFWQNLFLASLLFEDKVLKAHTVDFSFWTPLISRSVDINSF